VEPQAKVTELLSTLTKLRKQLIICLVFFLLTATAGATEYIVKPAPSDQVGTSINGEKVTEIEDTPITYWQFLLWLATINVITSLDLLYPRRFIFAVAGCRIVNPANVLNNPSRFSIYNYIRTRPGAYISEIVEKVGLDRGSVKHHIKTLEGQHKIEAYKEGGKTRYFENNFTYNEEEIKIISVLQNTTNKRIVSEIKSGSCNTNMDLAHEFGVSRATISWYVKNLREVGLISETKNGRQTIYEINNSYKLLIEKYGQEITGS
jgi:predicted transcriptional regulator